jgi:hypothetical protein
MEGDILELRVNKTEDGCNFCRECNTGNCNEDLILHEFDYNGMNLFNVQVFLDDGPSIELYLDNSNGDSLCSKKVKIEYCPMCGKKL